MQECSERGYDERMQQQGERWGTHYLAESRQWIAWLEHPLIGEHYARAMNDCDGVYWIDYIKAHMGGPARRSLDLGCASGFRSFGIYDAGASLSIEGTDVSGDMIADAERQRAARGAPGQFWQTDVNTLKLEPGTYDLIFSCHAFHHFVELEHIMQEVHDALTPNGLFMLEEYVGPSQFQWPDEQMALVRALLAFLPDDLRRFRWGEVKVEEIRMDPEVLDANSPFEAIRSSDIVPLFEKYFDVVFTRSLGGTIQHLLYNGIIHNFDPEDAEACAYIEAIAAAEDAFIRSGLLRADFQLLLGRQKSDHGSR
ncbi:MAG TPA: class I SAM-dependent methyltransferase [Anaerolineae bacterium]|nr:class I SAM-dependent methyltransferase [Anaerolineae bacterium]